MHETGIVRDLIRRIEQAAADAGATRVSAVSVRIGALSEFSPVHFREHFGEEAGGTLAEGAVLHLEVSDNILDPHAQGVAIEDITLEAPDKGG